MSANQPTNGGFVDFPIDVGTLPATDPQVNDPRLTGSFVNREGQIQLFPNIKKLFDFNELQSIFKSTFKDRIIVATERKVFYIENGATIEVGDILGSSFATRMDENQQNQVTIVNGAGAWVFSQRTGQFAKLGLANGFEIENPVDVVVLNTFTIIVGGVDKQWIVSRANNALFYDANLIIVSDESVGDLTGCRDLDNNLYIFGTGGVQRWVPSTLRLPTDFPFTQDPTYRDKYGCVTTASLLSENNEIFYLSSNGQIRHMTPQGRKTITNDGIERIITTFDVTKAFGSYFYHKGYYLYFLSFIKNNNGFVYCPESEKWSENNDKWLGFSEFVALKDGVYELTTDFLLTGQEVIIQSPFIYPKSPNLEVRARLGAVYLEITQGKAGINSRQTCFLQLSKDNVVYSNRVSRDLSPVGKRLFQFRWYMNFTNTGFSLRFTLELKDDIVITRAFGRFI